MGATTALARRLRACDTVFSRMRRPTHVSLPQLTAPTASPGAAARRGRVPAFLQRPRVSAALVAALGLLSFVLAMARAPSASAQADATAARADAAPAARSAPPAAVDGGVAPAAGSAPATASVGVPAEASAPVAVAPIATPAPTAAPAPVRAAASAPSAPSAAPSTSAPSPPAVATPPAAAASGSAGAPESDPGEIRVHDKTAFVLRAARAGHSAPDRAKAANAAIEGLLAQADDIGEARFEEAQGTAVVFVGKTPIVTLGQEDVEAAGEASLNVLAAHVTTRLGQAVSTERKRSAIATTVFSFSLLVFSALLAFLFLNRLSEGADRLKARIGDNPEKVTGLHLGKIEFVSAGAARGGLSIALTLGHRFIQVALGYGWLIFALSLFDATRGYTERLTGLVVKPLYGLAARIGSALPLIVVAAIAVLAVTVLVRFVGLFFDSISRGDTRVLWLSRDLARPTSAISRFGIIVIALVLASPLITGEPDGVLSRVGLVALVGVALAATPLLASAVVGVTVVFGRRMKRGDDVEVGGRKGKVLDVTLLEVRIEDEALAEVTVPHLLSLVHPTRVHRHARLATLDIVVDSSAPQDDVERVLFAAARAHSSRGRVELVHLDACGAHWRVTSASMRHDVSLAKAVQDALAKLGVRLGGKGAVHAPPASASSPPAGSTTTRPEDT
jgi:small-conductance mechanosensitive channel